MAVFEDAIRSLESTGLSDVILPFILVFTVVFAIMQKTKILGEKKNFNVIISFVLAMGVIIPHVLGTYPQNRDVVNIINSVLPQVSMILIAILAVLLMLGIWGMEIDIAGKSIGGWITILSMVVVFVLFGSAAKWFSLPNFLGFLDDPETKSLLIIILVFGIIIGFITSDDDGDDKGIVKKLGEGFGGLLNKK